MSTSVTCGSPFTASASSRLSSRIFAAGRFFVDELGNTSHSTIGILGSCFLSASMINFTLPATISGVAPSSMSLVPINITTPLGSSAITSSARRTSMPRVVSPEMPRLAVFTPPNLPRKSSPQPCVIESPKNTSAP